MDKKNPKNLEILQTGNIYFLFRPKLGSHGININKDEAQRFIMVLNPSESEHFIQILIGRKELPRGSGKSYFALVTNNFHSRKDFEDDIKGKLYHTKTKGDHYLSAANLLGQGKYLLFLHHKHTDLAYKLSKIIDNENIQKNFNLKDRDQFIIQVKNITRYAPTAREKIKLPEDLIQVLSNYKFVRLMPIDFLYYDGIELLLNSRGKKTIFDGDYTISKHLSEKINKDFSKSNIFNLNNTAEKVLLNFSYAIN